MLLVDLLQENDFLEFEYTTEWHFSCINVKTGHNFFVQKLTQYGSMIEVNIKAKIYEYVAELTFELQCIKCPICCFFRLKC